MIKLVITDIDGTIVDKDEILHDEFVDAITQLRQHGIEYTFATGRVDGFVEEYAKKLKLTVPYATGNGGAIHCGGRTLVRKTIPVKPLKELMLMADEMGMSLLYSVSGQEKAYRVTDYIKEQQLQFGRYQNPSVLLDTDWGNLNLDKLIVMAKFRDGSLDIIEEFCKKLPSEFYYKRYANKAIDILHIDDTKEKAAEEIARLMGLSMDEVLAAGDDLNDIGMLKAAGIGVAVGNALDCVKDAADYVCEQKNYKGVIEAIEKFCNNGGKKYERKNPSNDGANI